MHQHLRKHHLVTALVAAAFAACALVSTPAVSATDTAKAIQTKKLAEWKCEDFLALDETYRPKAIYWAAGNMHHHKHGEGKLDVEGAEKIIPMIITECTDAPDANFVKKITPHLAYFGGE